MTRICHTLIIVYQNIISTMNIIANSISQMCAEPSTRAFKILLLKDDTIIMKSYRSPATKVGPPNKRPRGLGIHVCIRWPQ